MSARIDAYNLCQCCGAVYGRPRYPSGRLEQMSQFAKRRFCSHRCAVECTGKERAIDNNKDRDEKGRLYICRGLTPPKREVA